MSVSLVDLAESRWLPDWLIRFGIRRLLRRRLSLRRRLLKSARAASAKSQIQKVSSATTALVNELRESPLVIAAADANHQHYEVPTEFFRTVLGQRLKYSCGIWPRERMSLDESEVAMLALTCERAEIKNGMEVLDLGCGWGSLSLWIAEKYPACKVLAVSNSATQREYIEYVCAREGIHNLQVRTSNIADFTTERTFDRVVSIEMFEHVRNYELLLEKISDWLKVDGKLFVHIFCHRVFAYLFESEGPANWMAKNFFTGGIMPSANLLGEFSKDMEIDAQWLLEGSHYSRTCEAWLDNLDANAERLIELFCRKRTQRESRVQLQRWRMFFMACSELFRFRNGGEWGVGHYLLSRRQKSATVKRAQGSNERVFVSS